MTAESAILHAVLARLGSRPGVRCWRNNTGAGRTFSGDAIRWGLKGSADILGLIAPQGRFLAVEVKTPDGRQSSEQVSFQRMIEKHGGIYLLVRSADEAEQLLTNALK
jgi:hypothetical protein